MSTLILNPRENATLWRDDGEGGGSSIMLEGAFSFRGRIGRLRFFLNQLSIMLFASVAGIAVALMMTTVRRGPASLVFFFVCFGLIILAVGWFGLSLYARRIRDIGWDPVVVLVGWTALSVFDAALSSAKPGLAMGLSHHTPIGGLFSFSLADSPVLARTRGKG